MFPDAKALLHGIVILGLVGLIGKLHKWDESAVFFDGSSLGTFCLHFLPYPRIRLRDFPALATVACACHLPRVLGRSKTPTAAYIFALAVYMTVGIPACRTVADPVPNVDTKDDQIEALRVLSAGNTIIIVLLGGILALQVSMDNPSPPNPIPRRSSILRAFSALSCASRHPADCRHVLRAFSQSLPSVAPDCWFAAFTV